MDTTSWISLGVMAVLVVLYMMRRKARLSRED
jgi:cytochrome oxidase assembly protein ShyY1